MDSFYRFYYTYDVKYFIQSYPKYIHNIKAILKPISIFSFLGISLCFIQTINIAKDNNSSHYQSSVGPGGIFMFIALTLICVYVF